MNQNLFHHRAARLAPLLLLAGLCLRPATPAFAADPSSLPPARAAEVKSRPPRNPAPTFADVPYGPAQGQGIDFWQAKSDRPTPVVFFVHGGGWVRGDKSGIRKVATFLDAGISVVSVGYRFTWQAAAAGVNPPVKLPMDDIRRALQFVRSKAGAWNIDTRRIGGWGASAGACSLLWLALHPDMADPASADPVARESTRLWCVALASPQTTLDPKLMREWTPNSSYGAHAFGFPDPKDRESITSRFDEFFAHRDQLLPLIEEYSPITYAGPGAPPMLLVYDDHPSLGHPAKDPTHAANFAVKFQEKLKRAGDDCEVIYGDRRHDVLYGYLIKELKE